VRWNYDAVSKAFFQGSLVFVENTDGTPVYDTINIAFIYAFKSKMEITFTGIAFPNPMRWENFPQAIKVTNFWNALINSLITTVPVVVMLTIFCSMGAYIVARRNTGFYNFVYYTMVGAMLIPFQVIMTPLYLDLKNFGLINTLLGFILTRTGFQIAFSLLLMTGFVKNVPLEIEESANIDGAGKYKTFWQITFPLMRPIIFTTLILNTLYTWNDFQVAVTVLQTKNIRTLPLMQFYFFGENSANLNLAFAAFLLSMLPILVLYFTMQKYILSGITSGAIKG
jgi:raffinose/stachyose/melibiose transport system permease protein